MDATPKRRRAGERGRATGCRESAAPCTLRVLLLMLRVRLMLHPLGVAIKVVSHGREISAVPLSPQDKPQVLPMLRALSGTPDAPFGRF